VNHPSVSCKTVGHSNRKMADFIRLVKLHAVDCIVDVRSTPYSRRNPQFNRETLKTDLELNSISYVHMGNRLGARYNNPELLFPDGTADFSKIAQLPQFQEAIRILIDMMRHHAGMALMCAEKDPFTCHRFMLISRELAENTVHVEHIISESVTIRHDELERHMIEKYGLNNRQLSLFETRMTPREMLEEAYRLRNHDLAFGKKHIFRQT